MSTNGFSDHFKRDAVGRSRSGLSGNGGFAASGCQPKFAFCVEQETLEPFRFR